MTEIQDKMANLHRAAMQYDGALSVIYKHASESSTPTISIKHQKMINDCTDLLLTAQQQLHALFEKEK